MAIEVSEETTTINTREECLKCGKSLEGLKRRSSRKFCSDVCRTRHFALKRYYEIRDTPEYRAKRSAYEKKWRLANKDKWNARMKKAAKKYRDKKKLEKAIQSNTPANESSLGQQAGEREITSGGQGAMPEKEGNDQPSNLQNNTAFVSEDIKKKRNNYGDFE